MRFGKVLILYFGANVAGVQLSYVETSQSFAVATAIQLLGVAEISHQARSLVNHRGLERLNTFRRRFLRSGASAIVRGRDDCFMLGEISLVLIGSRALTTCRECGSML